MKLRPLLLATLLLTAAPAFGQSAGNGLADNTIAVPSLRANVTVSSDLVRIGDVIDNAGPAAQIAIYRAPDLGTTGALPTGQLLAALRAHQVIGVDTHDLREVTVTRLARTVESREIEAEVARALEHRSGLGDAANLALTFDRELSDVRLEASNTGALQPVAIRVDPKSGRFDVTFDIANDQGNPTRLRFTGTAVETVEAAVLARNVERNETLKASDLVVERRPKAEVGVDAALRARVVGMQLKRSMRAGQALKAADLVKPDLVQRDQTVTLIYQAPGLYLTLRGKALENGAEGDTVSVMNLQSKRTVAGVVIGRGQVAIQLPAARPADVSDASVVPETHGATASLALANNNSTPHAAPTAE